MTGSEVLAKAVRERAHTSAPQPDTSYDVSIDKCNDALFRKIKQTVSLNEDALAKVRLERHYDGRVRLLVRLQTRRLCSAVKNAIFDSINKALGGGVQSSKTVVLDAPVSALKHQSSHERSKRLRSQLDKLLAAVEDDNFYNAGTIVLKLARDMLASATFASLGSVCGVASVQAPLGLEADELLLERALGSPEDTLIVSNDSDLQVSGARTLRLKRKLAVGQRISYLDRSAATLVERLVRNDYLFYAGFGPVACRAFLDDDANASLLSDVTTLLQAPNDGLVDNLLCLARRLADPKRAQIAVKRKFGRVLWAGPDFAKALVDTLETAIAERFYGAGQTIYDKSEIQNAAGIFCFFIYILRPFLRVHGLMDESLAPMATEVLACLATQRLARSSLWPADLTLENVTAISMDIGDNAEQMLSSVSTFRCSEAPEMRGWVPIDASAADIHALLYSTHENAARVGSKLRRRGQTPAARRAAQAARERKRKSRKQQSRTRKRLRQAAGPMTTASSDGYDPRPNADDEDDDDDDDEEEEEEVLPEQVFEEYKHPLAMRGNETEQDRRARADELKPQHRKIFSGNFRGRRQKKLQLLQSPGGKLAKFKDGALLSGGAAGYHVPHYFGDGVSMQEVSSLAGLAGLHLDQHAYADVQEVERSHRGRCGAAVIGTLRRTYKQHVERLFPLERHQHKALIAADGVLAHVWRKSTPASATFLVPSCVEFIREETMSIVREGKRNAIDEEAEALEADSGDVLAQRVAELVHDTEALGGGDGNGSPDTQDVFTGGASARERRPHASEWHTQQLSLKAAFTEREREDEALRVKALELIMCKLASVRSQVNEAIAQSFTEQLNARGIETHSSVPQPTDDKDDDEGGTPALAHTAEAASASAAMEEDDDGEKSSSGDGSANDILYLNVSAAISLAGGLCVAFGLSPETRISIHGVSFASVADAERALGIADAQHAGFFSFVKHTRKLTWGEFAFALTSDGCATAVRVQAHTGANVTCVPLRADDGLSHGLLKGAAARKLDGVEVLTVPRGRVLAVRVKCKAQLSKFTGKDSLYSALRPLCAKLVSSETLTGVIVQTAASIQGLLNSILAGVCSHGHLRIQRRLVAVPIYPARQPGPTCGAIFTTAEGGKHVKQEFRALQQAMATGSELQTQLFLDAHLKPALVAVSCKRHTSAAAAAAARLPLMAGLKGPNGGKSAGSFALRSLAPLLRSGSAAQGPHARMRYRFVLLIENGAIVAKAVLARTDEERSRKRSNKWSRVIPRHVDEESEPFMPALADPNLPGNVVATAYHVVMLGAALRSHKERLLGEAAELDSSAQRLINVRAELQRLSGRQRWEREGPTLSFSSGSVAQMSDEALLATMREAGWKRVRSHVRSRQRRAAALRSRWRRVRRTAYATIADGLSRDPTFDVILQPKLNAKKLMSGAARRVRQLTAAYAPSELHTAITSALRWGPRPKGLLEFSEYATTLMTLEPVGIVGGRPVHAVARPARGSYKTKVQPNTGQRVARDLPYTVGFMASQTDESTKHMETHVIGVYEMARV